MNLPTSKRRTALALWRAQGAPRSILWKTLQNWLTAPFYAVYERALLAEAVTWAKPRHIGVIMDGNRRFARGLGARDVAYGHQLGADKLKELLDWCYAMEIGVVTVWGFALSNFQRDNVEVQDLLALFERKTLELVDHKDIHDNQVRVRYIGKVDLLPDGLREAIRKVESATAGYSRFVLNIALAYGGREEISDAFRAYLDDQHAQGKTLQDALGSYNEHTVNRYLYTSGLPEPDLIIRTSGEVRMSGFLMWQSANSEYYFCDINWPAFRKIDFLRALRAYDGRHRRFGR